MEEILLLGPRNIDRNGEKIRYVSSPLHRYVFGRNESISSLSHQRSFVRSQKKVRAWLTRPSPYARDGRSKEETEGRREPRDPTLLPWLPSLWIRTRCATCFNRSSIRGFDPRKERSTTNFRMPFEARADVLKTFSFRTLETRQVLGIPRQATAAEKELRCSKLVLEGLPPGFSQVATVGRENVIDLAKRTITNAGKDAPVSFDVPMAWIPGAVALLQEVRQNRMDS